MFLRVGLIGWVTLACIQCASSNGARGQNPLDDARARYDTAVEDLEDNLFPEALKGFSELKAKYPYSKYASLADLRTADTHFKRGKFLEAIDAYRRFLKFYPNHDEAPYSMLQIGESYFKQIPEEWWFLPPPAEKDQGNSRLAITAYRDMLVRYTHHPLADKARDRLQTARTKLADHEMYVARFYFTRDHFRAAMGRSDGVLKTYTGLGHDAEALWITGRSRYELGDGENAQSALQRLSTEFPKSEHHPDAVVLLQRIKAGEIPEPEDPQ